MNNHVNWSLIDKTAEELGARKAARLKWRQRGVPPKWQISIMRKLMADGIVVSLGDFDALAPESTSA